MFVVLLPDGSKPQGGVCHNLTFTTAGLRLTGELIARYFALLMVMYSGPPYEKSGQSWGIILITRIILIAIKYNYYIM